MAPCLRSSGRAASRALLKPLEGKRHPGGPQLRAHEGDGGAPAPGFEFVRQMQDFLSVRRGPHKTYRTHRDTIERLARATAERRTVQRRYFAASRGATTRREVDPYHLWYVSGTLYLIAYDHRRRAIRTFGSPSSDPVSDHDRPSLTPTGC